MSGKLIGNLRMLRTFFRIHGANMVARDRNDRALWKLL